MAKSKRPKKKPAAKAKPAARRPAAKKAAKAPAKKTAAKSAKKAKPAKKAARKVVIPPPLKGVAQPIVPIIADEPEPAPAAPVKEASGRKHKPSEIAEIRELLLKRREELLAEIREELDQSKISAQQRSADPTDQASDSADGDLAMALAQSDSAELNQIDAALARSETSELGICEECGGSIPMERLRHLPYATTCTACKRRLEQQGGGDNLDEAWEAVTDSEEEQEGEEE